MTLLRTPAFLGYALVQRLQQRLVVSPSAPARPICLSELMGQPPSTYGLIILLPMACYMLRNAGAGPFRAEPRQPAAWCSTAAGVAFTAAVVMVLWYLIRGARHLGVVSADRNELGRHDGLGQPAAPMAAGLQHLSAAVAAPPRG